MRLCNLCRENSDTISSTSGNIQRIDFRLRPGDPIRSNPPASRACGQTRSKARLPNLYPDFLHQSAAASLVKLVFVLRCDASALIAVVSCPAVAGILRSVPLPVISKKDGGNVVSRHFNPFEV